MGWCLCKGVISGLVAGLTLFVIQPSVCQGQAANFVPPPRNIADITSILDQEKPDPAKLAKMTAEAEAQAPPGVNGRALSDFYYKRAQVRSLLGRTQGAIEDSELAIKNAEGADYGDTISRIEQFLYRQLRNVGQNKRSLDTINSQIRYFSSAPKGKGRLFGLYLAAGNGYLTIGDLEKAKSYFQRNNALYAELRSWPNVEMYRSSWLSNVEEGNARMFDSSGRFADAEKAFHHAVEQMKDAVVQSTKWPNKPAGGILETIVDVDHAFEGRAKARQGRMAEAEVDIRQALLASLGRVGKYHPDTALILSLLTGLLMEQGRYPEAEHLARATIDIYRGMGYPEDASWLINSQIVLATLMNFQRRPSEAAEIYAQIDKSTANWPAARRDAIVNDATRVVMMISTGNAADAIEIAKKAVERAKASSGEKSFSTMRTRGYLAFALARAGRDKEAYDEFKEAIPVLLNYSNLASSNDENQDASSGARDRTRTLVEVYIGLLARNPSLSKDVGEETYRLADVIRGQSVQRALSASAARASAKDPALALLARTEQDSQKQIGAVLGALNNQLALPAGERDDKTVKDLQAEIAKLQATGANARREIAGKFPQYANLIDPAPATPADVRALLNPEEAVISYYFGRFNSFVWVISKSGNVKFSPLGMTLGELESKVSKLRKALEPQAETVSDIPQFDLALAYELYRKLLYPVESGWKDAKSLIVVTNGALGLLPMSLLPTALTEPITDEGIPFVGYRKVPWLARTHAVTVMPSTAALRTLRQLPPSATTRDKLIAFGDPLFSKEQADEATGSAQATAQLAEAETMRGMPLKRRSRPQLDDVQTANLSMLPRLPDTADELKSIAAALEADPTKALNLGKDANESKVKATDLSKFKIVAFSTHGLVPGELDGLTQPALALTAPSVADVDGDGLLTMEEILGLKLDADWVVLSACNTGTGAGAGAEAASGLGRAFFYAGTRALLVTNWSVNSQSARELVTDLFRRQAIDPKITRGEALRQAMVAMIDRGGYNDAAGKMLFSYAHPLFWAPYSIIGDGGAQ